MEKRTSDESYAPLVIRCWPEHNQYMCLFFSTFKDNLQKLVFILVFFSHVICYIVNFDMNNNSCKDINTRNKASKCNEDTFYFMIMPFFSSVFNPCNILSEDSFNEEAQAYYACIIFQENFIFPSLVKRSQLLKKRIYSQWEQILFFKRRLHFWKPVLPKEALRKKQKVASLCKKGRNL